MFAGITSFLIYEAVALVVVVRVVWRWGLLAWLALASGSGCCVIVWEVWFWSSFCGCKGLDLVFFGGCLGLVLGRALLGSDHHCRGLCWLGLLVVLGCCLWVLQLSLGLVLRFV